LSADVFVFTSGSSAAVAAGAPGIDLLRELFSSRMRAAVLGHVLLRPHLRFSLTDLSRVLDQPISSLQHECYKLERIGLLRGRRDGNSRRYQVVPDFPLLAPLTRMVADALGLEVALRASLDGVTGVKAAFAAGELPIDPARLSLRVVVIGEVPLDEIDGVQERACRVLGLDGAQVETVFYSPVDWASRLANGSGFASALLDGHRVDLAGDVTTLARSGA
jgi:DNA-binding transcriptional ArsR family regulator